MLSISDTYCVGRRAAVRVLLALLMLGLGASSLMAQEQTGGEANLKLPDLRSATFWGDINGHTLLLWGLLVSALGLVFGLIIFTRLKNLPVHSSMLEISELIYETCKTYLLTQGKFLMLLEAVHWRNHRFLFRLSACISRL